MNFSLKSFGYLKDQDETTIMQFSRLELKIKQQDQFGNKQNGMDEREKKRKRVDEDEHK